MPVVFFFLFKINPLWGLFMYVEILTKNRSQKVSLISVHVLYVSAVSPWNHWLPLEDYIKNLSFGAVWDTDQENLLVDHSPLPSPILPFCLSVLHFLVPLDSHNLEVFSLKLYNCEVFYKVGIPGRKGTCYLIFPI